MNAETQAMIVKDCGGHLAVAAMPSRESWAAMLKRYAPGCGAPTYVEGTNGGQMPCGGNLTSFGKTKQYFCALCDPK